GEVDDDASVAHGVPREAMASPAHGGGQSVFPGEVHGANDVRRSGTAGNERWMSVKHPVPELPGLVVGVVARSYQLSAQPGSQLDGSFLGPYTSGGRGFVVSHRFSPCFGPGSEQHTLSARAVNASIKRTTCQVCGVRL